MKKLRQLRLSFLRHNIAANAGAVEDVAINSANTRAFTGEEWEQITPWGDFPNKAGLQRLNKTTGQRMVDAFNSLIGKVKRAISPVPVFSGHPDVDPDTYKDDRRYGGIDALEARDDGLWCKPAYNDLGKQNKDQGYWIYPSGVWKFKRCPGGVIEPYELLSVGLTNHPVIKSVQPWTRNAEDRARNAGTSTGALKGWATRRANGAKGAGNKVAAKIKAMAVARHERASAKLRSESSRLRKQDPTHPRAKTLDAQAETHDRLAAKKAVTPPPLPRKETPPPLPSAKDRLASATKEHEDRVAEYHALPKNTSADDRQAAGDKVASAAMRQISARRAVEGSLPKAMPPPLPKSTSAGAGNHVHIHFASNSFYGKSRLKARRLRKKQTNAAA